MNHEAESRVVVGLGSNLGDSCSIIHEAFERLRTFADGRFAHSSLWRTTPVDCPPGSPQFVNAAVAFKPVARETPESLLEKLQALEREFGRRAKVTLNEPRPLDLDLICFGNEVRNGDGLNLPHPRAHQRRFVLAPMAELVPDLMPRGWAETVAAVLANLESDEVVERFGIGG